MSLTDATMWCSMEPVSAVRIVLVMVVGGFTGLLGGLFGKGGSAVATPLLALVGIHSFAAVASPLPATIPATILAAYAYHRAHSIDWSIVKMTALVGVPATIAGAIATRWIGGTALVLTTDIVVCVLGVRILTSRREQASSHRPLPVPVVVGGERPEVGVGPGEPDPFFGEGAPGPSATSVAAVGVVVGLASGLLGNSGGFLLAPLFATVLRMPLKRALGTSLAAAAVLAVPGTVVHAAMGHIDWTVTLVFGLASVPLSAFGARLALRTPAARLEVIYGVALVLLGGAFLILR
jgi:uncharacterized protein